MKREKPYVRPRSDQKKHDLKKGWAKKLGWTTVTEKKRSPRGKEFDPELRMMVGTKADARQLKAALSAGKMAEEAAKAAAVASEAFVGRESVAIAW